MPGLRDVLDWVSGNNHESGNSDVKDAGIAGEQHAFETYSDGFISTPEQLSNAGNDAFSQEHDPSFYAQEAAAQAMADKADLVSDLNNLPPAAAAAAIALYPETTNVGEAEYFNARDQFVSEFSDSARETYSEIFDTSVRDVLGPREIDENAWQAPNDFFKDQMPSLSEDFTDNFGTIIDPVDPTTQDIDPPANHDPAASFDLMGSGTDQSYTNDPD